MVFASEDLSPRSVTTILGIFLNETVYDAMAQPLNKSEARLAVFEGGIFRGKREESGETNGRNKI